MQLLARVVDVTLSPHLNVVVGSSSTEAAEVARGTLLAKRQDRPIGQNSCTVVFVHPRSQVHVITKHKPLPHAQGGHRSAPYNRPCGTERAFSIVFI